MMLRANSVGSGRRALLAVALASCVAFLGATPWSASVPAAASQEPATEVERDSPEQERPGADGVVYRLPVTGVIELGLAPFIERGLREAEREGATAVVLDMETPGGRVDAAQRIANALGDSPVPVYTYVNRRALSAGALIALASDAIYVRPGSVIGAATPVTGEGDTAPEKIVSAMRSEMRSLAEARGLDPRVAEAMVDADIEIPGVVDRGKLLTLTGSEAVELGYAKGVADWDELVADLGLAGAATHTMDINWAERVVRFLTHPLVTPLLLSVGFLGLIFEVKSPGVGLPGLAGVTALGLFFGSHYILGLAGWEHVILLLVGLVLLVVEIFLVPGFTVFGLAGAVAILASIYLSMVGQLATGIDYTRAAAVLSTSMVITLVAGWAVARMLPRSSRFMQSGILLGEATRRDTGYVSVIVRSDLLGLKGVAVTDLRPAGTAEFGDERVDVVSEAGWIPAGSPIQIVRSEGYRQVVRPVKEQAG